MIVPIERISTETLMMVAVAMIVQLIGPIEHVFKLLEIAFSRAMWYLTRIRIHNILAQHLQRGAGFSNEGQWWLMSLFWRAPPAERSASSSASHEAHEAYVPVMCKSAVLSVHAEFKQVHRYLHVPLSLCLIDMHVMFTCAGSAAQGS